MAPTQYGLIIATLLALLAFAVAIERTRIGRLLPAPAVVLICAMALANLGVLPQKSAAYEQLARVAVPVGVFLLLLRADIRRIFRETGSLLGLYLIGAVASLGGVLLALLVVPMPDGSGIAAVQLANLVGGTVNVVAVAHAVQLDSSRFTAMMAGAAVVMNLYLIAMGTAAASPLLNKLLPGRPSAHSENAKFAANNSAPAPHIDIVPLALLVAGAVGTWALCDALLMRAGRLDLLIIAVSVVALAIANLAASPIAKVAGDRELGTLLLYLFFATLGVSVNLRTFGGEAARVALFILIAMTFHLAVLCAAGRLLRASRGEVLIASIAGVAGPTTAAAMAASFGERDLITPGVLCGLLGFATATFAGMALYAALNG